MAIPAPGIYLILLAWILCIIIRHGGVELHFSHSEVCFTVKDKSSSMGVLQWG